MNKDCETGPTIYHPYPRRLESLTITKAALSLQLFKDPECWSGRGLNPRPPAREPGALPTEPTGRRLIIIIIIIIIIIMIIIIIIIMIIIIINFIYRG